jgi:hypothetical protein
MALPPFDVVDSWLKPVVAETTGVSTPAKRQAATPRRDSASARIGAGRGLDMRALHSALLDQYCGGTLPMILHRKMNAHRTAAGGWHGTRDH